MPLRRPFVRPPRRRGRRIAALTAVPVVALVTALTLASAPVAGAAAAPGRLPADESMPSPSPGQEMGPMPSASAGAPGSSATPSANPSATAGETEHAQMPVEALPPQDYAAGSLVRVQVWATISVAVHLVTLYKAQLPAVTDPRFGGSGVVVTPTGVVVTAKSALATDQHRLEVYGVNQAFARFFRVPLPADPFTRTHAKDHHVDEHLQACYTPQSASSECAVFVTREIRVYPYLSPPDGKGLRATQIPRDSDIAVLSTDSSRDLTTAQMGAAQGSTWTAIGWPSTPAGRPPVTVTGPIQGKGVVAAAHLATIGNRMGTGAAGSVVVDAAGRVIGMVDVPGGKPMLLPADMIAEDLRRAGVEPRAGTLDAQFRTALDYVSSHEYGNAMPYLERVVKESRGQAVAVRYRDLARSKMGTAEDMTAMANSHTGSPARQAPPGRSGVPVVLLVLLLAGLAALAAGSVWLLRRRRQGAAPAGAAVPAVTTPPSAAATAVAGTGGARSVPDRAVSAASPGGVPSVPDHDTRAPEGAQEDAEVAENQDDVPTVAAGQDAVATVAGGGAAASPAPETASVPVPRDITKAASSRDDSTTPPPQRNAEVGRVTPADAEPARAPSPNGAAADAMDGPSTPALSGGRFCSSCGVQLAPGDRFCFSCGAGVGARTRR